MTGNSVTIYQNGIAAFKRVFDISGERKISLPFKQDQIGDVIASLSILGDVQIVEAPNYSPNKQKPSLELNPGQAYQELFNKVSGALVNVALTDNKATVFKKARLVGFTTENNLIKDATITQHWLTLQMEDGSFVRLNFNYVASVIFTDPKIQNEIQKALDWNLERINPESVYLNTTLRSEKPTQVLIQYTKPSPAFKFAYRLKQTNHNGAWKLLGFCVVDNIDDEDWENFMVNCATGQPVTFSTDIAEIRIPDRQKVNLVNQSAVGSVEAPSSAPRKTAATRASMLRGPIPQAASMNFVDAPDARQTVATAIEIGDSSFFRGIEAVTIPSKKSALVKVIDCDLRKASVCLYYQPNESDFIMRTLQIINELESTLGRGVCPIEQEGEHVGSSIMPTSKPGEMAMLCYAAETGVKVFKEIGQERTRCTKHSLSGGVLVSDHVKTYSTTYVFRNVKNEDFVLFLDHTPYLQGGSAIAIGASEISKLKDGVIRYRLTISPKNHPKFGVMSEEGQMSVATVTVAESLTTHSSVKAGEFLEWVNRNPESPLLKNTAFREILDIKKQIADTDEEIIAYQNKLNFLTGEQDRLRKNIDALKDHQDAQRFRTRLVNSDDEIVAIQQKILPDLNKKRQALINTIREAVTRCTAGWSDEEFRSKDQIIKPIH